MDVTHCLTTNGRTDRVTLPTTTDINGQVAKKAFGGWFMVTAIQLPPCRIYGEGDATQSFAMILGMGNRVTFEVDDPSFTLQVYSDSPLVVDRPYHLYMEFYGSADGDVLKAYVDGVEQTVYLNDDSIPGAANLTTRGVGESSKVPEFPA